MGKIILASSSPRRADILKKMNFDFVVIPSSYVEDHNRTDFSYDFVENLAYNKALNVAAGLNKLDCNDLIIAADTIVVADNLILGKPSDRKEAFSMLRRLSGITHFVVTAVSIIKCSDLSFMTSSDTTYVSFNNLTDEQIYEYIDNFKPYDKAGAYGIQELPEGFVSKVEGEFDNVVGLPSKLLLNMLNSL